MPSKVILKVVQGKLIGKEYIFDSRDTCLIGRSPNCQLQIPNDKDHNGISRYHCLLDINPPDVRICDSGSRNGTFVNDWCIGKRSKDQTPLEGARVNFDEWDLKDGDRITLGRTVFQVIVSEEAPSAPSPQPEELESNQVPPAMTVKVDGSIGFLDGYEILQELETSDLGEVYLAKHEFIEELVAVKTLSSQVPVQPHMKEMFLLEARKTKQLDHPNLVKFKDHGHVDDLFYFVMEYCDRGSVTDLMAYRDGSLSVNEATKIILQILDGLHYAHTEMGMVHRDIKPDNIVLVEENGELTAKLGDYGLAKSFDLAGLSGQTATGDNVEASYFKAKQQVIDFKYSKPDVDIWAVAATLYFMLTGNYPRDFATGDNPLFTVLKAKPVPIRQRDETIPEALAKLIDLALDDDIVLVFQDALSFKNALLEAI